MSRLKILYKTYLNVNSKHKKNIALLSAFRDDHTSRPPISFTISLG